MGALLDSVSEKRDIIDMRSMKTLLLAIFILFFLLSNISAKPSPKHFLVEAKDKAKKNNDYIASINTPDAEAKYIARKNNDYDVVRMDNPVMCILCREKGKKISPRENWECCYLQN